MFIQGSGSVLPDVCTSVIVLDIVSVISLGRGSAIFSEFSGWGVLFPPSTGKVPAFLDSRPL